MFGTRVAIISKPIRRISFKLQLFGCPGPFAQLFIELLKKKHFLIFHDFFSIYINIGLYGSDSSLKSLLNFFKLLSLDLTKVRFWIFEILSYRYLRT